MAFNDKQINQLEAPLLSQYVSKRKQGTNGPMLSYIEGWHAIAEANRIFGYHGWQRKLTRLEMVSEWKDDKGRARISYLATVEIVVTTDDLNVIHRWGTGSGHGIDNDPGMAHESAAKEAETDAMKRALMTFGNPFGLALYDKTQANVSDVDLGRLAEFEDQMSMATDLDMLNKSIEEYTPDVLLLKEKRPADWRLLNSMVATKMKQLKEEANATA